MWDGGSNPAIPVGRSVIAARLHTALYSAMGIDLPSGLRLWDSCVHLGGKYRWGSSAADTLTIRVWHKPPRSGSRQFL
jgi:hypothetical protein